jgi:hypothetical protein
MPRTRDHDPAQLTEDKQMNAVEFWMEDVKSLEGIRQESIGMIKRAQARQKASHDSKKELKPLKIGDQVIVHRTLLETTWTGKMEIRYEGPYIVKSIKGTTYTLRKMNGTIIPDTFHRNRLRKYNERRTQQAL